MSFDAFRTGGGGDGRGADIISAFETIVAMNLLMGGGKKGPSVGSLPETQATLSSFFPPRPHGGAPEVDLSLSVALVTQSIITRLLFRSGILRGRLLLGGFVWSRVHFSEWEVHG